KVGALPASMQFSPALRTTALDGDAHLQHTAARRTTHLLAERHHSGRARPHAVAGLRLRLLLALPMLLALPIIFHVAMLAVFPISHFSLYYPTLIPRGKPFPTALCLHEWLSGWVNRTLRLLI